MKTNYLQQEIEQILSDWDGDFLVSVNFEESANNMEMFWVEVKHKYIGNGVQFAAKVGDNGNVQMDFNEDCWKPLTMGNLFALMWFQDAELRAA